MSELSVVIPAYNEAESIERLVDELALALPAVAREFDVIVVDDASTDETPAILHRLAAERAWLHVERAGRNAGHGPSVIRGLDRASAEWILQIDSDGQFVVTEVALLWAARDACDVALGVRVRRNDPRHRLLLTRAVRIAARALGTRGLRDVNTPFRLVRRAVWEELRPLIDPATLAPNIFVSLGASVRGWRVVEVPVTHLPRATGTASLRTLRLLRFSLRGLAQLVAFRVALARTSRPGHARGEP
jgi:dolichol-phosphate mannosyltransferase